MIDDGSEYTTDFAFLSGTPDWYNKYYATMPGGGNWTNARWNTIEVGAQHNGGQDQRVHSLISMVAYLVPTIDISNTPSSEDFGVTNENTTYWAKTGSTPPSFPLTSGNCTFAVTNNSGVSVDIVVSATNFSGGVGATLTDSSPGANTVRMSVYREGDGSSDNTTLAVRIVTGKRGII